MFQQQRIVGSLALASILVSGLSGDAHAQQIVSGGQVSQIDVSVGPVFPVPWDGDEGRERRMLTSASHDLLPGQPFAVFVGDAQTGAPLQILHVGEVPEAGSAPFFLEVDNLQDAGLALFFESQGLSARINGRTGDGRGMGKNQTSDLVPADSGTAKSTSARRGSASAGRALQRGSSTGPVRLHAHTNEAGKLVLGLSPLVRHMKTDRVQVGASDKASAPKASINGAQQL